MVLGLIVCDEFPCSNSYHFHQTTLEFVMRRFSLVIIPWNRKLFRLCVVFNNRVIINCHPGSHFLRLQFLDTCPSFQHPLNHLYKMTDEMIFILLLFFFNEIFRTLPGAKLRDDLLLLFPLLGPVSAEEQFGS